MNVSKGDLALVVDGPFKGATCTVEFGDGWWYDTEAHMRVFMWVVRFPRPMPWRFGPTTEPRHGGLMADRDLRKLAGPGPVDEVTTEQDKEATV